MGSFLFPSFYPSLQCNCWRCLKSFSSFSTLSFPQLHMGLVLVGKWGDQPTECMDRYLVFLSLGNSGDYFPFFCLFSFTSKILDTQNTQDSSFHLHLSLNQAMFLLPSVSLPMFKFLMDAFHPTSSFKWGMLKLTHPHGPGLEDLTTHPISQRKTIPQCELSCSQLCILLCMQLLWAMQTSQKFSVGDCGCPKVHQKDNQWDFQIFSTGLFPKSDSFRKLHCCHLHYLAF